MFLRNIKWNLAVSCRLINMSKVTESLILITLQFFAFKLEKVESETWEKNNRDSLSPMLCKIGVFRNCAKFTGMSCAGVFFNKDAGLKPATLFKKRLRHRRFNALILHTFNFSRCVGAQKFNMTFNQNLWNKAILGHDTCKLTCS